MEDAPHRPESAPDMEATLRRFRRAVIALWIVNAVLGVVLVVAVLLAGVFV